MNLTEEIVTEYRRVHKFTREKFINEIRMMHEVSVFLKEKPRVKIGEIEKWTDFELVKGHKFYWDKL